MELRRYLRVLRRRIWFVVICSVLGLLGSYLTATRVTVYEAETLIYVGTRQFVGQPSELSADRAAGVATVARTFAIMMSTPPIARDALAATGVDRTAEEIVDQTTAQVVVGTSLIQVLIVDEDPAVARDLANAVSDSLVTRVQQYEPGTGGEGEVPSLPAYVFARAELPEEPVPLDTATRLIVGLFFGFVLAAGIAFLLDYLDITPRTPEDIEHRVGLPTIGVIPELRTDPPLIQRPRSRRAGKKEQPESA